MNSGRRDGYGFWASNRSSIMGHQFLGEKSFCRSARARLAKNLRTTSHPIFVTNLCLDNLLRSKRENDKSVSGQSPEEKKGKDCRHATNSDQPVASCPRIRTHNRRLVCNPTTSPTKPPCSTALSITNVSKHPAHKPNRLRNYASRSQRPLPPLSSQTTFQTTPPPSSARNDKRPPHTTLHSRPQTNR